MPVATSTERDPGGNPIVGARVVIRLLTSPGDPFAPGYVPDADYTVSGEWATLTDSDGEWSTPDMPSTDDIVPANSVYVADMIGPSRRRIRRAFTLPAVGGPHRVEDNLADPPADMPTLLSDVVAEHTAAIALAAFAPLVADQIVYVSRGSGASDAHPGLSAGKAKATVAAALAAVPTGGYVQMLGGTFDLLLDDHPADASYQVGGVVYSGTILRGLGAVTRLRIADNQPSGYGLMNRQIAAGGDDGIVFEDFVLDGNNVNQAGDAIHQGITLLRARNVKHHRVWVMNCRGTALSGPNESFHFDAQLSSSISYTDCCAVRTLGSTASGFAANASTDVTYSGCRAWGMTVTNGFTHNGCVGVTHVNCQAFLNGAGGFNSESSDTVAYDSCTAGGKATTGNLSHPYSSGQSLGNAGIGFIANDSTNVLLSNCVSRGNQHGLWCSGPAASGRIVGGSYSDNSLVGINFVDDSETRFKVTATPVVSGNGSSPYRYTAGFAGGPGVAPVPPVPASGVALTNPFPFDAMVIITGGTVFFLTIDGANPTAVSGTFPLPFGKDILMSFSAPPTWVWILY